MQRLSHPIEEIHSFVTYAENIIDAKIEYIGILGARNWWIIHGSRDSHMIGAHSKVLFAIPTSSASSERAWNIYDLFHGKRRNRITPERLTKLVSVYIND